ncbi:MAG: hypothetical protein ABIG93_04340 [archaeon]|nr:hypothetical protein [Nanoarchaeota archaeon]
MSSLRNLVLTATTSLALAGVMLADAKLRFERSAEKDRLDELCFQEFKKNVEKLHIEQPIGRPVQQLDGIPRKYMESDSLVVPPGYQAWVGELNENLEHSLKVTLKVFDAYEINYVINEDEGNIIIHPPDETVMDCSDHEFYFKSMARITNKVSEDMNKIIEANENVKLTASNLIDEEIKFFNLYLTFYNYTIALVSVTKEYDTKCGFNLLTE